MAKKPPALKHNREGAKKKSIPMDTMTIAAVAVIAVCLLLALVLILSPAPPAEPQVMEYCGDAICSEFETCQSCSQDCGKCEEPEGPVCGDLKCELPEDCSSCPADCGECPEPKPEEETVCGDGICSPSESCDSCSQDCECPPAVPSGAGTEEECSDCITVYEIHENAFGDDNFNLNDEYVRFKNRCEFACDLTGWSVTNEDGWEYVFPDFVVLAKGTFVLYSGSGKDSATKLYWDSKMLPFPEVWENKADMLFLRDTRGVMVYSKFYGW